MTGTGQGQQGGKGKQLLGKIITGMANTAQMGEGAQLLHVAQEGKLAQSLSRR